MFPHYWLVDYKEFIWTLGDRLRLWRGSFCHPPELVSLEECFTWTQKQTENRNQSGNATPSAASSESRSCIDLACVSLAPFEWKNNRKWLKLEQPFSHFRMWAQGCLVHSLLPAHGNAQASCGTLTLLIGRELPLCLSVVLFRSCPFACFSFFQCLDNKENSP